MAADKEVSTERSMMIACYALYELRDLIGADEEPASFKRTRRELRRRLEEGDAGSLGEEATGARLRLVH
jgi:hypothetical protein